MSIFLPKLITQTSYWKLRLRERFCLNSRNVPPICRICDFKFEFECVRGILVRELLCVLPLSFSCSLSLFLCERIRRRHPAISWGFLYFLPPLLLLLQQPRTNKCCYELRQKRVQNAHRVWQPRKKKVATCVVLSVARLALESHVECLNHDILADFLATTIVWELANWILRSTLHSTVGT